MKEGVTDFNCNNQYYKCMCEFVKFVTFSRLNYSADHHEVIYIPIPITEDTEKYIGYLSARKHFSGVVYFCYDNVSEITWKS